MVAFIEAPQQSLRELYVHSSQSWSFIQPVLPHSQATQVEHSYLWQPPQSSPFTSSVFGSIPTRAPTVRTSVRSSDTQSIYRYARSSIAAFVLQYGSVALVNPFEVGKVLLQVQWVPRRSFQVSPHNFRPEKYHTGADTDWMRESIECEVFIRISPCLQNFF
jgi:hypothetical protein